MQFENYIRKPFTVEALVITEENMEEVAALVGEVRTKGDVTFIALDRRVVPNVQKAYVGWYMTRLGDNYRCYSPKVFAEQFDEWGSVVTFSFESIEEPPPLQTPDAEEPISDALKQSLQAAETRNVFDEQALHSAEDLDGRPFARSILAD